METADFESTRDIFMVVSARQGSLINLATLTVSLTDDNDVPPRFISKEQSINLPLALVYFILMIQEFFQNICGINCNRSKGD